MTSWCCWKWIPFCCLASWPALGLSLTAAASPAPTSISAVPEATSATIHSAAAKLLRALSFPVGQAVDFTEQQFNPLLERPIQSSGQVWREADGGLVMALAQPLVEQRHLRGDRLSITRDPGATAGHRSPHRNKQRQLRLSPTRPAQLILLAVGALLNGEHDWLQQRFELSLGGTPDPQGPSDEWELLLVPMDPNLRDQLNWIQLHGRADQLERLRADRGSKGWQQIEFHQR